MSEVISLREKVTQAEMAAKVRRPSLGDQRDEISAAGKVIKLTHPLTKAP